MPILEFVKCEWCDRTKLIEDCVNLNENSEYYDTDNKIHVCEDCYYQQYYLYAKELEPKK